MANIMTALEGSSPVILRAEHLGRTVNGKILVQDANFELHKGEVLAIVGPSGSGKTTLLKCMAGIGQPSAGSVLLGADPLELERQRHIVVSGKMIQQPEILKHHADAAAKRRQLAATPSGLDAQERW